MSTRNPVTGRRRAIRPGDRIAYELPEGPPADAVASYGGDAQAAITVGLSLLTMVLRGGLGPQLTGPSSQPPVPPTQTDPLSAVAAQSFFTDS